jgi:transcriptional regulator with XRE-family HTH domain
MARFGEFVRLRREELGITLRGLAKQIEVSGAYMSKMERGLDSPPTPAKIKKLAEILKVDPDHLLGLANKMDPQVQDILRSVNGMPAFLRTTHDRHVTIEELNKALERVIAEREEGDERD